MISRIDKEADCLITVYTDPLQLSNSLSATSLSSIKDYSTIDKTVHSSIVLVRDTSVPGSRHILCPIGQLDRDYDDIRNFSRAIREAIKRAISAGSQSPMISFCSVEDVGKGFEKYQKVSLLAALQESWEPEESRAWKILKCEDLKMIRVVVSSEAKIGPDVVEDVSLIEEGRVVARTILEGDPEVMSAIKAAEYLVGKFKGIPNVSISCESRREVLEKKYPLLSAVARASWAVPRHHPVVVKIEYKSSKQDSVKDNLFFVGKGITYDTGGADVKTGGHMRGMSRDKGGAAGVAGFMYTVAKRQPDNLNVSALLGFVRNSIGADSYVSDEIIVSRAGVRVLVGNTDAEGRMVMADLLAEQTEAAVQAPNPHLFTVATLTGHVIRAYGMFPACLDNGPAKAKQMAQRIAAVGESIGEPWEISTLRKEDYDMVAATSPREDVVQCNTAPSTMTSRGHQFPAAFMAIASGLSKYGNQNKERRLAYTHMDIAGATDEDGPASGSLPKATGAPVATLFELFLK